MYYNPPRLILYGNEYDKFYIMVDTPPPTQPLGAPPYLYAICHSHTKQVKRFVDWTKGGFGGKLGDEDKVLISY